MVVLSIAIPGCPPDDVNFAITNLRHNLSICTVYPRIKERP